MEWSGGKASFMVLRKASITFKNPGSTLVLRALLRWSGVPADDVLDSRLDWTDDA